MPDSNASFSEDRMTNETQSPRAGDGKLPQAFDAWWYDRVADNSGASIGADYKHWARMAWDAALAAAPAAAPAGVGCKHRRYSLDKQEQVGHCIDCGAEGRMVFVANQAPATADGSAEHG